MPCGFSGLFVALVYLSSQIRKAVSKGATVIPWMSSWSVSSEAVSQLNVKQAVSMLWAQAASGSHIVKYDQSITSSQACFLAFLAIKSFLCLMWGYERAGVGEAALYKPLDSCAIKRANTYPEYMYSLFLSELTAYSSQWKKPYENLATMWPVDFLQEWCPIRAQCWSLLPADWTFGAIVSILVLVRKSLCCQSHLQPLSLPVWMFHSCTHHASTWVANDQDWPVSCVLDH